METMQLPSRVVNVLAALRTQGYEMKFSSMADGDIYVGIYKDNVYRTDIFLREELGFDMFECSYREICKVIDPRVQKKSAAVLKYLEGIIEY